MKSKVFVSSDHHFYHRNIIKYAARAFNFDDPNCVIHNAKLMIERHNTTVANNDFHIFAGDMSANLGNRKDHFKSLLQLLKGKKILVRGNHDHQPDQFYIDAGFIDVVDYFVIDDVFINHYPCYKSEYNSNQEKEMMKILDDNPQIKTIIHGHIHNKDPDLWEPDGFKRINACVDFWPNNYYPIELTNPSIKQFLIDRYC